MRKKLASLRSGWLGLAFIAFERLWNVVDTYDTGQSILAKAAGAPPVISWLVLFLTSDIGRTGLLISGFVSVLLAVVVPIQPIALTKGGSPKKKQPFRTNHPFVIPSAGALIVLAVFALYAQSPFPPIYITMVPRFETTPQGGFPLTVDVRNGDRALENSEFFCALDRVVLESAIFTDSVIDTQVSINGVVQPLKTLVTINPNDKDISVTCYRPTTPSKISEARVTIGFETSLSGMAGRRRLSHTFKLSKSSFGAPLWKFVKRNDQWLTR
jgi:hypothetical protein